MKKYLLIALTLLMAVTMQAQMYWNGTSNKVFSGSGTQADPYLISTPEQLAGLAERVNTDREDFAGKYIKLTADIYLTDFTSTDTANWKQWEPIGHIARIAGEDTDTCVFKGHFDGNNHSIFNLYYGDGLGWGDDWDPNDPDFDIDAYLAQLDYSSWYRALFGFIGGSVENLTLNNTHLCGVTISPLAIEITPEGIVRNCHAVNTELQSTTGTLAGLVTNNYGLIENSSVTLSLSSKRLAIGGLVYENKETGIIRNCSATGTLSLQGVSGAAGLAYANEGLIEQCTAAVDITTMYLWFKTNQGNHMASGFVQVNRPTGIIRECVASGNLQGDGFSQMAYIAGFCYQNLGFIESCYATGNLTDLGTNGNNDSHISMAQFVFNNGVSSNCATCVPEPGFISNSFATGTVSLTDVSSANLMACARSFVGDYYGGGWEIRVPSRQINCYWNTNGLPSSSVKNQLGWTGYPVTISYMQSQAFVDTLNAVASFLGTSQWEYRAGQLPRATGVRTTDKTVLFAGGQGTKEDPYQVATKEQLRNVSWLTNHGYDFRNEYILQTADIALNAPQSEWGEVAPVKWQAIGTEHSHSFYSHATQDYFRGTYDGGFHEVQNMYLSNTLTKQGFFGQIDEAYDDIVFTSIRNLAITDAYVRAKGAVGILAGDVPDGYILIQCRTSGDVRVNGADAADAGAFIGAGRGWYGRLLNCSSSAYVDGNSGGTHYTGAVYGANDSWQRDTCVNYLFTGNMPVKNQYAIVNHAYEYKVNYFFNGEEFVDPNALQNYATSRTTAWLQSKECVNIYNTAVTQWNSTHGEDLHLNYWEWRENDYPRVSPDASFDPGATITYHSNGGTEVLPAVVYPGSLPTPPTRPHKDGFIFAGWFKDAGLTQFYDFTQDTILTDLDLYAKWLTDDRNIYDLTPFQNEFATTYHIQTLAQLRGFAVMQNGLWEWNYAESCGGYTNPTQTVAPMSFAGKTVVLDNDIFINDTANWQNWGNNAYAVPWKPIGQPSADEDGTDFLGTFDGNGHIIYGLYCELNAAPADVYGGKYGWGLFGSVGAGAIIRNLGIKASVIDGRNHPGEWLFTKCNAATQNASHVGMIAGRINGCSIETCFAEGQIIAFDNEAGTSAWYDGYAGGLAGARLNTLTMTNCYSRVNIAQYPSAKYPYALKGGGLVGSDNSNNTITLTNCYSASNTRVGKAASTCYYDKELVAEPGTDTSAKSSFSMHTMSNYAGWDFETVWARNDDYNDGYPVLRIFHPGIENSPEPVTVTGITLQETSVNIMIGDSIQLHASVVPEDAANQNITWSSNKPTIAPVDENGFVRVGIISYTTAVVITATTEDGNYAKKCTLNIKIPNINNYYPAVLKSRRIGDAEWQEGKDANAKYTLNWEYIVGAYTTQPLSYAPFAWQSSDESVLTVASYKDDTTLVYSGNTYRASLAVVQCVGEGTATVTVTNPKYNGISAQRNYTVLQYNPTSMTINENYEHVVEVGDVNTLTVTTEPAATSFVPEIIWSTDAPNVVAVNENGVVEALAAGTATVTATCGTLTASVTFTVNAVEVELTSIALSEDSVFLYEGETVQMVIVPTPANALLPAVTWTSDKPSFATVDRNTGLVTAVRKGSARITAYAGSLSASCVVTVESDTYYTITFVDYDGTELQSSQVLEGEMPVYTGATPARPGDDTYTYEFSGWYPEIVPATANTTYKAQYTTTEKPVSECENVSGSWLQTGGSGLGEMTTDDASVWTYNSSYGAVGKKQGGYTAYLMTPAKNLNGMQTVTLAFNHAHRYASNPSDELTLWVTPDYKGSVAASQWQQLTISPYASNTNWTFVNVTINVPVSMVGANTVFAFKYKSTASAYATWEIKNLTLTAVCAGDTPQPEYYTIRFLNWDNTVLQSSQVKEGTMPAYSGAAPTRAEDDNYTYMFSGWSPTIVAATADADYTAQYTATEKPQPVYYTILFVNWDNTELQRSQVLEGEMPVYEGTTPVRPEDEQYIYTFNGWTPTIVAVTADATYTATFEAKDKSEGIEDIFFDASSAPRKVLIDNVIFILRGEKKYTITGVEVK